MLSTRTPASWYGNTSSTSSRATCRRTASAGRRPAADPETGNVYALGPAPRSIALSKDGKLLWQRSIGEEFSAFTTHGGRTASPLIDGDLVIVSAAHLQLGRAWRAQHRFVALDKRTGDIIYVASAGRAAVRHELRVARLIATINGLRLLISGSGDGAVHAIKPQTGEKIWGFVAAKRAINTGVVVSGTNVFVSHGDENLDTLDDGDDRRDRRLGHRRHQDHEVDDSRGPSSGFRRRSSTGSALYQLDNSAVLHAYELETGRLLFEQQLGTGQKAPLVLADGKLYVGTENGRFFTFGLRPDRVEVLNEVQLPISTNSVGGSEGTPEQIVSGAAISRGRVFFVSSDAVLRDRTEGAEDADRLRGG